MGVSVPRWQNDPAGSHDAGGPGETLGVLFRAGLGEEDA